jgi:hypothetical protein
MLSWECDALTYLHMTYVAPTFNSPPHHKLRSFISAKEGVVVRRVNQEEEQACSDFMDSVSQTSSYYSFVCPLSLTFKKRSSVPYPVEGKPGTILRA